MGSFSATLMVPLATVTALLFLGIRLRFLTCRETPGRYAFLSGAVLVSAAAVWQAVKALTVYQEWFIEGAYGYIDMAQFIVFLLGSLLVVVAFSFYADFWQMRSEELFTHDQKLALLSDLQRDAREPYHLLELLDLATKEIVSHVPDTMGAVFLVNRSRRQFVLAASAGLSQQETALLEHYPLDRNIISQSIDLAEPVITGGFTFVDPQGKAVESRFRSCLVLPMISGSEKIGGIILFSQQERQFNRAEVRFLSPVAEWLAEKINSARLSRELTQVRGEMDKSQARYGEFTSRLLSATGASELGDTVEAFCQGIVGLSSSQSVHLFGLVSGALRFYGGSEPLADLSENYRTALIEALDKNKPLIINQEVVSDEGRSYISLSSLIFPVRSRDGRDALLLRKESAPFKVGDPELKALGVFAGMAQLVLKLNESNRLNVTRRKGFEQVIQLLRFEDLGPFSDSPGHLLEHLASCLPRQAMLVSLVKQPDASFLGADARHVDKDLLSDIRVYPGEGEVGRAVTSMQPRFASGRSRVSRALESYDMPNREAILKLLGEKGVPSMMATCPVACAGEVVGAVMLFVFDVAEDELSEWERVITLIVGLYSMGLTVEQMQQRQLPQEAASIEGLGPVVNQLNNYLSAIIGNAELGLNRDDISGDAKSQFHSVLAEAEQAAGYLKKALGELSAPEEFTQPPVAEDVQDLVPTVEDVIASSHISDNLYMIAGSPREVTFKSTASGVALLGDSNIKALFRDSLESFAALAETDDVITVSVYESGEFIYLDISRHKKNFPPVESVAGFGNYEAPQEVLKYRPSDAFLEHLNQQAAYSFDRFSRTPSYLSFKFPLSVRKLSAPARTRSTIRILAIDDQAIILDLLTAMCQSLGYEIKTASSGQEGIALASESTFDVVFTDLAMPGMSGLEVAKKIKAQHAETPIILLTGWEASVDSDRLVVSGITEVLYKPFRIEQLTDVIKSVVRSGSIS